MSTTVRAWCAVVLALAVSACAASTGTAPAGPPQVAAGPRLTASGGVNTPAQQTKPYLVLISIDGFKAEYLDRFELPHLRRLGKRGARAKAMIPVFPSLTFPNHYSLVTGLHPQRHGIVSNRFYDPARKDTYALGDARTVMDGSWYGGEPIWVTAESQGMVAACYFWPGSEAEIKGVRPTTYTKYASGISNETRVQTVLDWLRLPAERRPHVITLYFSEVDEASHSGPLESPDVLKAAQSVDAAIGSLAAGLDGLPIRDQVYLLITSDHGMVNGSDAQTVRLESLLDAAQLGDVTVSFGGPVANLHIPGGPARARDIRDRINVRLARGTAYLRQEVPERLQFRENPRAGDVVVVMDESWVMSTPRSAARTPTRTGDATVEPSAEPSPAERPRRDRWGMHGWDNAFPSMRAFFLVSGPGIRQGAIVDEVRTVDVFSLMTELLDLRPAPGIDGESDRIRTRIK